MMFVSASSLLSLFFLLSLRQLIRANELTFELPDNAEECFHDKLKAGSTFILEFQVCQAAVSFEEKSLFLLA